MAESKQEEDRMSVNLLSGPQEMTHAASVPVKLTRDKDTPVDIYPWFEITVQDIDVTSQKWHASVEIHLFWQDFGLPTVCPNFEQGIYLDDMENQCPVKLSEIFENKVWERAEPPVLKYLPETSTMYMLIVVTVEFVERMELERFPMDRQFLGMDFNAWVGPDPNGKRLNWNWITNPPDWVQNDDFRKPFAVRMLSSITEYEMLSPWVDFSKEQPLSIRLRVERDPGFYFGSVIIPNFLIVMAAFAAFPVAIDDEDMGFIADRLSISVTLMLTAVAFRYVITEQLPKVTYLTVMDYYLLLGFIMLTLLIFENAFIGIKSWSPIKDIEVRKNLDTWCMYIVLSTWLVMHIWWMVVAFNKSFMRIPWEKMDELDQEEAEEFRYCKEKRAIGCPQSKEVLDEWKKFSGQDYKLRASVYAEEHPELLLTPEAETQEANGKVVGFDLDKDKETEL